MPNHPPSAARWRVAVLAGASIAAGVCVPISMHFGQWALFVVVLASLPDWGRVWRADRWLLAGLGGILASWVLSWAFSPRGPAAFWEAKDSWTLAIVPALVASRPIVEKHRAAILAALTVGVALAGALALIQVFTRFDPIRQEAFLDVWGRTRRASGFYRSPMTFGGMMALAAAALLPALLDSKTSRRMRLILTAGALMAGGGLLLAGSRSYWLPVVGLVIVWGSRWRLRGVLAAWSALVIGFGVAIALAPTWLESGRLSVPEISYTAHPTLPYAFTAHIYSPGEQRVPLWESGLACIRDHPLTGTGRGPTGYNGTIERYTAAFGARTGIDLRPNHLHNNALQIVAETGLIGLLAVGLFTIQLVYRWIVAWRQKEFASFTAPATLAGVLVVFAVSGLFEYSLGDLELILLGSMLIGLFHPPSANGLAITTPTPDSPRAA